MKTALHILMFVINCTWGFIQSFIGFIVFLIYVKKPHFWHKGSIVTTSSVPRFIGGMSLGVFIFLTQEAEAVKADKHQILEHEYGHFLQSLLLGPLYIIGAIFSVLKVQWFEGWADRWGKAYRRISGV